MLDQAIDVMAEGLVLPNASTDPLPRHGITVGRGTADTGMPWVGCDRFSN
jgi:hypothetical protein